MIYLFLADGFEDVEAIGTIDILRRCGLQVQTLSVSGKRVVTSAHGVVIKADSIFRKNHLLNCEAMVFPGGLKGAESMAKIRFCAKPLCNRPCRAPLSQRFVQHP